MAKIKRVIIYSKNGNRLEIREDQKHCFVGKGYSEKKENKKEVNSNE